MILPLRHEGCRLRRWPWVTFAILAVCVLVQLVTASGRQADQNHYVRRLVAIYLYMDAHPYLQLPPTLRTALFPTEPMYREFIWRHEDAGVRPPGPSRRRAEQRILNELAAAAEEARDRRFDARWGFVPARCAAATLVTALFLHGGWVHLLSNLLFLFVVGPGLEDAWGRLRYAGFFVLAGAFTLAGHAAGHPGSNVTVIGASGAIAAFMGAFLIRFGTARIRLFCWFVHLPHVPLVLRPPAWLILSLWFGQQLWAAWTVDRLGLGMAGGVAYGVHISGFVLGLGVAAVLRLTRYEERVIAPRLESRVTLLARPRVEEALALAAAGHSRRALAALRQEVARDPADDIAVLEYWQLAMRLGRAAEAAPALAARVASRLCAGAAVEAVRGWLELRRHVPGAALAAPLRLRLLGELYRLRLMDDADALLAELAREAASGGMPPGTLRRLAETALVRDPDLAAGLVERLAAHPEVPPAVVAGLRRQAAEARARAEREAPIALRRAWPRPIQANPRVAPGQ